MTTWTVLEETLQPSLQTEELLWAEEVCRKDLKVKEACDAIGMAQDELYIDGE